MHRWVLGTVVSQKAWSESLYSIYVSAPIEPFIPGQFIQIGLMIDQQIVFRPYSFTNAVDDPILEFYYSVLPQGQFTPRLAQLEAGDSISIARKPTGRFTLESVPQARDIWLLATGTGLGVFLSMLQSAVIWQRFSNVILAHSVRLGVELTHMKIIDRITQEQGERFNYVPIVTREPLPSLFNQRLPTILRSGALEEKIGIKLDPNYSHVMLCGNPLMVKDVVHVLAQRGLVLNRVVKPGHITIESYWKEKSNT